MNAETASPCGSFLLLLLAALLKQGSAQVSVNVDVRNILPPRSFPLSLGPSRVVDDAARGLGAYLQDLPHSPAGIAEEIRNDERQEAAQELPVKGSATSAPTPPTRSLTTHLEAEETKAEPKEETRNGPNEETNVDKTEEQDEKVEIVKEKTGSSNKTIVDGKEANETKKETHPQSLASARAHHPCKPPAPDP